MLDPDSANTITDVSLDQLRHHLWSLQLVVRRSPPDLVKFYQDHLPGFVGDAASESYRHARSWSYDSFDTDDEDDYHDTQDSIDPNIDDGCYSCCCCYMNTLDVETGVPRGGPEEQTQ